MRRGIWVGEILVFIAAVLFFILAGLIYRQSNIDEIRQADAIVVMGASQWNGEPSPVFKARLDDEYDLYNNGYAPKIILTGGVGENEEVSESSVGKKYLENRGLANDALFLEETGRTSWRSLSNIVNVIEAKNINSVILVSDGFHMLRLKRMASDLGIINYAVPVKNSPIVKNKIIEFKYAVREIWVFILYLLFKI